MTSTTTIILSRPNTDNSFFYDSQYYINNQYGFMTYYNQAITDVLIVGAVTTFSPDNLVCTRVIVYNSPEDKAEYCSKFYGAYPAYLETRTAYCESVGHTIEVIED
jgi:hypothetical protein